MITLERSTIKTIIAMQKYIASKEVYRDTLTHVCLQDNTLMACDGHKAVKQRLVTIGEDSNNPTNKAKPVFFTKENCAYLALLLKNSDKYKNTLELTEQCYSLVGTFIELGMFNRLFEVEGGSTSEGKVILESNVAPTIGINLEYLTDISKVIGEKVKIDFLGELKYLITPNGSESQFEAVLCGMRV